MDLAARVATMADLDALRHVVKRAVDQLQVGYLTLEQTRASRQIMGVDTQLLRDGTYFILEDGDRIAGCGGWSYRRTLFGGDASVVAREPTPLDHLVDAARIRAMYTDPDFTRRGIGRHVLHLCENAAISQGFRRAEMMATMAGEPLYRSCGYVRCEEVVSINVGDVSVPLVRMGKMFVRE